MRNFVLLIVLIAILSTLVNGTNKKPTSKPVFKKTSKPVKVPPTKKPVNTKHNLNSPTSKPESKPANKHPSNAPQFEPSKTPASKPVYIYPSKSPKIDSTKAPKTNKPVCKETQTSEPSLSPTASPSQSPTTSECNCFEVVTGPVGPSPIVTCARNNKFVGVYLPSDTNFTSNLIVANPNFPQLNNYTCPDQTAIVYDNIFAPNQNGLLYQDGSGTYNIYLDQSLGGDMIIDCAGNTHNITVVAGETCPGNFPL